MRQANGRDAVLWRDAAAIGAATGVIGLSFGAIAVASGLPAWVPASMSVLVFAGGSQFLAVALMTGSPIAAVAGGVLINARHLPFGLAVGPAIGRSKPARFAGAHLVIDESTAFALAERHPERRARAFWAVGLTIFVTWNVGTLIGIALGGAVSDPAVYGLDAAFPAGLLALLLPSLRDRATRAAAIAGSLLAVATTPLLPAGLPVLAALLGVGAALLLPTPSARAAGAPADAVRVVGPEPAAHQDGAAALDTQAPRGSR
ncbi:AzlC family ABC transporter permease [Catellatospora sichuanensis]|uniref:AzlC family ABC transporter permease n=1 Tax=Catellatospora sichuanensis TaxID=1969805 RepID=UPI001183DC14|nr:AzlC family ABC transporter permease [Catellatospora sichuanensis]